MGRVGVLRYAAVGVAVLALHPRPAHARQATPPRSGPQVYETICITCHGPDGRGGVNAAIEQIKAPPDFADCAFANREPDRGFLAVAHNGGPARGFSPIMPPWGSTFTEEELTGAIGHIRTFCKDPSWPRGELNLPLALATGKAFPEDEAVMRVTTQSGSTVTRFVYERRFGSLNQWEVAVPISSVSASGVRATGMGDIALGYKRVLAHSLARGNILSASAEVALPTGRESKGLGGGVAVFEPFVTFGQILPGNGFFQGQIGVGIPADRSLEKELFWRGAVGKSLTYPRFGRYWSPMVEVLAARPLTSSTAIEWDVMPEMQVTLNARQHIRLNGGVRLPVTGRDHRSRTAMVYLLWDWYEGGLLSGW